MTHVPTRCNICNGEVMFVPTSYIYHGKDYGSGFAYICKNCGAYVGTHRNNKKCAMGLLADNEMRSLRKSCHELFDSKWSSNKERTEKYAQLAEKMGMPIKRCHFAWMNKDELKEALSVLGEL